MDDETLPAKMAAGALFGAYVETVQPSAASMVRPDSENTHFGRFFHRAESPPAFRFCAAFEVSAEIRFFLSTAVLSAARRRALGTVLAPEKFTKSGTYSVEITYFAILLNGSANHDLNRSSSCSVEARYAPT